MPHATSYFITEENESEEQGPSPSQPTREPCTTTNNVTGEFDYLSQKSCDETSSSASGTVYSNGNLGMNNGITSVVTNDGTSGNNDSNTSIVVVTHEGTAVQLIVPTLAAQVISNLQQQVSVLNIQLEQMRRLALQRIPVVHVQPITGGGNLSSSHASDSSYNNIKTNIIDRQQEGSEGEKTTHGTASENEGEGERKGRWSPLEHKLFVEGLLRYGRRWKQIATLVKTRSYPQIKGHAQKYFHKLAKVSGKSEREICSEDFSSLVMKVEEMGCIQKLGKRKRIEEKQCLKARDEKCNTPSTFTLASTSASMDVNGRSTNYVPDLDVTSAAIELTKISEGNKSMKSSAPRVHRQLL